MIYPRGRFLLAACVFLIAACGSFFLAHAKKVLYYSEKRGIMWVEESKLKKLKLQDEAPPPKEDQLPDAARDPGPTIVESMGKDHSTYFKNGKRYFFDGDYEEALRYFEKAYRIRTRPEYYLFIAKCHRKLENEKRMLFVLKAIRQLYPESNVADDALFEMALHHEVNHNYQEAIETFKTLTEQYPYGVSITNNKPFRQIARVQIMMMEKEVSRLLLLAGVRRGMLAKRLRYFQKMNRLRPTGRPDKKTMQALLAVQAKREAEFAKARAMEKLMAKWRTIGFVFLGVLLVFLTWTFITQKSLTAHTASVSTLEKSIDGL